MQRVETHHNCHVIADYMRAEKINISFVPAFDCTFDKTNCQHRSSIRIKPEKSFYVIP